MGRDPLAHPHEDVRPRARRRVRLASCLRPGGGDRRPGDRADVPVVRPGLVALRNVGHPFFAPPWRADEVGLILDTPVDWDEVAELLTESYCAVAPKALSELVDRPGG